MVSKLNKLLFGSAVAIVGGACLLPTPATAQTNSPTRVRTHVFHPAAAGQSPRNLAGVSPSRVQAPKSAVIAHSGGTLTYTCDPSIEATAPGTCNYLNTTIAAIYSSTFTNVNANIYIQFGVTGLGQSEYAYDLYSYSTFLSALSSTASGDAVDLAALSSLPATEPAIFAGGQVTATGALQQALGFGVGPGITPAGSVCNTAGTSGCYHGIITVTTPANLAAEEPGQTLYFRQNGGTQGPDAYDFYTVVEHETDEVLGTGSCIDTQTDTLVDACGGTNASAVDLFRYSSPATRVTISTSPGAYFSYDGGVTNVANYNTVADGEDYADWSTNCVHVQDAQGCLGQGFDITNDGGAEIDVLDAIGYNAISSVSVTVSASVAGASFSVDGTTYNSAQSLSWAADSSHTLSTTTPQAPSTGTQYVFTSWSDGGALSHSITASSATAAYTANFQTQYLLSTSANPAAGGTVSAGGYYNAGSSVPVTATANPGYTFTGWTGTVASASSANTTIAMTGPQSVTANFQVSAGGPPSIVSLTPTSGSAASQIFTAVFADPNGGADLASARLLFNSSVNGVNACYVIYYPSSNALYLEANSGTTLSSPVTPGSPAQVSNSQCTLSGSGSSYAVSGNNASLSVALAFSATPPENIYLLATEKNGSSSGWVQKGTWGASVGLPVPVSVSPSSGSGITQIFSAVYSDPNGAADLATVRILFNATANGLDACYVSYSRAANALYLAADSGATFSAPVTPGSSTQVSNSQCTLSGTGSSYSTSGNNATLNVALTFTTDPPDNIYLLATENNGSSSAWVQKGTWGVSQGSPAVVSLSPTSGSGATQTFTAVASDPNGAEHLATVRVLFNSTISGVNACYVVYYPGSNQLYLYNNAGTTFSAAVTPGSSAQVSNSQCTLSGMGSSYSMSGNTGTLNVGLSFTGTAPQNVYLESTDRTGASSGWVQEGTWGISAGLPSTVSLSPNSGSGVTQAFTAVYSDPNGVADFATVRILFNSTLSGVNACYVVYNRVTNGLYLASNAGALLAPITPGSSTQVSNSQCTLSGIGSSYSTSGNDATLTVALTFAATVNQIAYLEATENSGSSSGWVQEGSWTP